MKKTQNVNIGGMVFTIDEDAYQRLADYLDSVEKHFRIERERKEIMTDIESRIGELLRMRLGSNREVIVMEDILEIMRILGDPDEFGVGKSTASEKEKEGSTRYYRRMYRDPDHRVLGGVCSGMGAYWHIDPVLFRILFLLAFLGFGVGILVYLLLWIILPPARTTAEKLEMRGEPVTFDTIGRFIKEEFEQVKENIKSK